MVFGLQGFKVFSLIPAYRFLQLSVSISQQVLNLGDHKTHARFNNCPLVCGRIRRIFAKGDSPYSSQGGKSTALVNAWLSSAQHNPAGKSVTTHCASLFCSNVTIGVLAQRDYVDFACVDFHHLHQTIQTNQNSGGRRVTKARH